MATLWNDPVLLLFVILFILVVDNLWSTYLLLREIILVYQVEQVPDVLRPYLAQDLFNRMRDYKLHKSWFLLINTFGVVVICGCLELYFGFFPFVWNLAGHCAIWQWMEHEICLSIIFVILLSIYVTLKSLPGHIYEKCCIPSLVNHPKQSLLRRILSEILDTVLSLLLMVVIVTVVVALVTYLGQYFFLGLYLTALLLTSLAIVLLPFVIDPIIGKRVPIENPTLLASLEELTLRTDFPMRQVHIIRVRDPNMGSNAFFYGACCLKRIVIFDTLLLNRGLHDAAQLAEQKVDLGKGLRDAQVVAVVAHELGHWKHGHFYKAMGMFQINMFLTLFLFSLCFPHGPIYQAIGFEMGVQPIVVGFIIIFGYVLTPYFAISNVIMLSVTRQFEYQADKFAFQLGYAHNLRIALLKLYADNLSFPISDECYSSWHHTHPTVLHRLARLEKLDELNS
ncbi:CAAX prenyl protease 1 homolog [Drosophila grimshawi]|uniref:CAAX prenyl protease n=1 Tax=Drosophila grimshawi TaxID=7222 RepID=B4JW13_DROGR|nr:CAAX prenyl protease 1 homolog [Drosophila grimshawi]EDV98151.1 GH22829 [Drosophila grimshawi]